MKLQSYVCNGGGARIFLRIANNPFSVFLIIALLFCFDSWPTFGSWGFDTSGRLSTAMIPSNGHFISSILLRFHLQLKWIVHPIHLKIINTKTAETKTIFEKKSLSWVPSMTLFTLDSRWRPLHLKNKLFLTNDVSFSLKNEQNWHTFNV